MRPAAREVHLAGGARQRGLRLDLGVAAAVGHADHHVAGRALEEGAAEVAPDALPAAKGVRSPRVAQAHVRREHLARVRQHKATPAVEGVDRADHRLDLGLCVRLAAYVVAGRRLPQDLARRGRVEREDRAEVDVPRRIKGEEVVRCVACRVRVRQPEARAAKVGRGGGLKGGGALRGVHPAPVRGAPGLADVGAIAEWLKPIVVRATSDAIGGAVLGARRECGELGAARIYDGAG